DEFTAVGPAGGPVRPTDGEQRIATVAVLEQPRVDDGAGGTVGPVAREVGGREDDTGAVAEGLERPSFGAQGEVDGLVEVREEPARVPDRGVRVVLVAVDRIGQDPGHRGSLED